MSVLTDAGKRYAQAISENPGKQYKKRNARKMACEQYKKIVSDDKEKKKEQKNKIAKGIKV